MKANIKKFVASSKLFFGFTVDINLNYCDNIQDNITIFTKELTNVLTKHNFEVLLEELKKINFHIHSYTFEDILVSKPDQTFYICECNNCSQNINLKIS